MQSNRPYLLRAFYQWIIDNKCTPILVLDATNPRCKVPQGYSDGGEIVFNVSFVAVRDFKITNDFVEFKASFSGVIHIVSGPINAVLALYAEENGEGLFLDAEDDGDSVNANDVVQIKTTETTASNTAYNEQVAHLAAETSAVKGKPFLTVVE